MSLTRRLLGLCLCLAPAQVSAASLAGDDWSLEHSDKDPALVAQRLKKLHRNPFDNGHWGALRKSLGLEGLAKKIAAGRRRAPSDLGWQILEARMDLARGQATRAADKLAALELADTRRAPRIFELRVTALERSADWGTLVALLEQRALEATAKKRKSALLTRAYGFANRGNRAEDALRIATALDRLAGDRASTLRLARAATDADDHDTADAAYARAVSKASGTTKLELQAERARGRMEADNPTGAAELLWTLLEADRGATSAREMWWSNLHRAHRQARTTDALLSKLGGWLERHPDEAAAWRTLAAAQQDAGINPIDAWRRAHALAPRDEESASALIAALEAKGEHEEAVAEVSRMLDGGSRDPTLAMELATHLAAAGERELAFQLAGDVEARFGRSSRALMQLLDFYNLNDDADHALEVARAWVRLTPRKPEPRIALGEQLHQMRLRDDALAQWAMLPKLIRPAHKGWARHAQVLSEHKMNTEAVASISKAMRLAPSEPAYLRLRAVLAEEKPDNRLALKTWEQVRALAVSPSQKQLRDEARTRVVELLVAPVRSGGRHQLANAVTAAQRELDKGKPLPGALEAGLFLAELHTRQQQYGAAVRVQQRMLTLAPADPNRLEELASAQRRAGQVESAMSTLEELLEVEPGRGPSVLAEMSELAFEAGDDDRALETATSAAQRDRSQVDAIVRLGELHESKGNLDAAANAYKTALETKPGALRPKLRLAELELTRGNVDRARALLSEALSGTGPAELMEEAGARALDLAEADDDLDAALSLAAQRCAQHPESEEPRRFLLDALDRLDTAAATAWVAAEDSDQRREALRAPLVSSLGRGSITTRLRAAEQLGRLALPDTAEALANLGKNLAAPRDATPTVQAAYERARLTAIRAAGSLQDPAANPVFVHVLDDSRYSWNARRTAAWALARSASPAGARALAPHVRLGDDAHVVALACIAAAERRASELDPDTIMRISQVARESRNEAVRHACTFAHAALRPSGEFAGLRAQVQHSDPLVAAIAAWRLGNEAEGGRRDPEDPAPDNIAALLRRALGPGGLARDASTSALVRLLEPSVAAEASSEPPPAPRGDAWAAAMDRWLRQRVVPRTSPVGADRLAKHASAIRTAVDAARTGTAAERAALEEALGGCPGDAAEGLCLPAVASGSVAIPN